MSLEQMILPLSTTGVIFLLLLFLRSFLLRVLRKWGKEDGAAESVFVSAFRTPSWFWVFAIALMAGINNSSFPEKAVNTGHLVIELALMLSITLFAANLSVALSQHALSRIGSPVSKSGLVSGLTRGSVFIMGFLIILSRLGISIAPLLTALGVGGLAVALALKDTLENLFSGIHLLIDKAIEVGDRIRLETGQEGVIEDIGWRTTKVALDPPDTLIIPNVKLAQSIVVRRGNSAARATPLS